MSSYDGPTTPREIHSLPAPSQPGLRFQPRSPTIGSRSFGPLGIPARSPSAGVSVRSPAVAPSVSKYAEPPRVSAVPADDVDDFLAVLNDSPRPSHAATSSSSFVGTSSVGLSPAMPSSNGDFFRSASRHFGPASSVIASAIVPLATSSSASASGSQLLRSRSGALPHVTPPAHGSNVAREPLRTSSARSLALALSPFGHQGSATFPASHQEAADDDVCHAIDSIQSPYLSWVSAAPSAPSQSKRSLGVAAQPREASIEEIRRSLYDD